MLQIYLNPLIKSYILRFTTLEMEFIWVFMLKNTTFIDINEISQNSKFCIEGKLYWFDTNYSILTKITQIGSLILVSAGEESAALLCSF